MQACARSIERPTLKSEDEEFCPNVGTGEVIVTFNGFRYLVPLCSQHRKEHDDAGAQRRIARRAARQQASPVH